VLLGVKEQGRWDGFVAELLIFRRSWCFCYGLRLDSFHPRDAIPSWVDSLHHLEFAARGGVVGKSILQLIRSLTGSCLARASGLDQNHLSIGARLSDLGEAF
jgi:hypothetical protein